jgi:hypothetical protein
MRLVLIDVVDAASKVSPSVTPTLFVDDLSMEAAGTRRLVLRQLLPFAKSVCDRLTNDLMEVSSTKSVTMASSPAVGRELAVGLRTYGLKSELRVRSLGVGLGAGTRRNAKVSGKRFACFRKRLRRFRMLARAGVSTARLLRTGAARAFTYGWCSSVHVAAATANRCGHCCACCGGQGPMH